jgi:hypothetical protein
VNPFPLGLVSPSTLVTQNTHHPVILSREAKDLLLQQCLKTTAMVPRKPALNRADPSGVPLVWTDALTRRALRCPQGRLFAS